ncbi:hypothetical protein HDK90DRAFT_185455 [Phyllosticta capitalensis]|uniref:C2H2-type domain-containing protein n=1 Tax=Phyllosticta capitalensis TaxID=121624 RepID=A0ABR1YW97_9PEZI
MQLSTMVHGTGRDSRLEASDFYQRQQPQHHYYHPQRVHHQPTQDVAQDYVQQVYQPHHHFKHQVYQAAPQSPPSPPVEEPANKPSLPSISSLLGIADGDQQQQQQLSSQDSGAPSQQASPSQQQPPPQQQQQQQSQPQPQQPQAPQQQPPPPQHLHQAQRPHQHQVVAPQPENRPDQAQPAYGPTIVSHPRMTLPPTPPMRPDSVIDGNQSPSTSSQSSVPQQTPYYLGQSINNMEPHQQRQPIPTTASMPQHRASLPPQHPASPYATSPYATSPYASSPGAAPVGTFAYPPEQAAMYGSPAVYGQRPLPSNFPPPPVPVSVPASQPGNPNPWQHHHYIGASSAAAFPQPQDRYICQTCNKAFSRPSSLRIHSHSHTGEKPFKCPHPNCGKAFSVRSNMKRHERGCHATASPSTHGS